MRKGKDSSSVVGGRAPFVLGGTECVSGTRQQLELPVARLPTGSWLSLPVSVIHGAQPGTTLMLDATIHGDELNGLEIIRQVLKKVDPAQVSGTIVAVPIVNVFGFIQQERYLPDRRDLNRSFPGSPKGSLAGRLAHLFLTEVVDHCEYAIDLHTGSNHRTNVPQIRANLDDPETCRIAEAFGAPMLFGSTKIAGSLRASADRHGVHLIVYEGGEPLRFNSDVIEVGVAGVERVMVAIGMLPEEEGPAPGPPTVRPKTTRWLRASRSGILRLDIELGAKVAARQVLGRIDDPFSEESRAVRAPADGWVIGYTNNPLVYQGDALVHVGMAAES